MAQPIISLDWGSTHFRAVFSNPGQALQRVEGERGLTRLQSDGFEAAFYQGCGGWLEEAPDSLIVVSGMAGARGGWLETGYLETPVGIEDLRKGAMSLVSERGHKIYILPGVRCFNPELDLMRGEETQVLGALSEMNLGDGLFCLPGTHSKWVICKGENMVQFASFVTGELFEVLTNHAPLIVSRAGARQFCEKSFEMGFERSGDEGNLLRHLFSVRSRFLSGSLTEEQRTEYLSGLVIGNEVRSAAAWCGAGTVHLIGSGPLTMRYSLALERLGREVSILEGDFPLTTARAFAALGGMS